MPPCFACGLELWSTKSLTNVLAHLLTHVSDLTYFCNKCTCSTLSKYRISAYYQKQSIIVLNTANNHLSESYFCSDCNQTFSKFEELLNHLPCKTGVLHQCNLCKLTFPSAECDQHSHIPKMVRCKNCNSLLDVYNEFSFYQPLLFYDKWVFLNNPMEKSEGFQPFYTLWPIKRNILECLYDKFCKYCSSSKYYSFSVMNDSPESFRSNIHVGQRTAEMAMKSNLIDIYSFENYHEIKSSQKTYKKTNREVTASPLSSSKSPTVFNKHSFPLKYRINQIFKSLLSASKDDTFESLPSQNSDNMNVQVQSPLFSNCDVVNDIDMRKEIKCSYVALEPLPRHVVDFKSYKKFKKAESVGEISMPPVKSMVGKSFISELSSDVAMSQPPTGIEMEIGYAMSNEDSNCVTSHLDNSRTDPCVTAVAEIETSEGNNSLTIPTCTFDGNSSDDDFSDSYAMSNSDSSDDDFLDSPSLLDSVKAQKLAEGRTKSSVYKLFRCSGVPNVIEDLEDNISRDVDQCSLSFNKVDHSFSTLPAIKDNSLSVLNDKEVMPTFAKPDFAGTAVMLTLMEDRGLLAISENMHVLENFTAMPVLMKKDTLPGDNRRANLERAKSLPTFSDYTSASNVVGSESPNQILKRSPNSFDITDYTTFITSAVACKEIFMKQYSYQCLKRKSRMLCFAMDPEEAFDSTPDIADNIRSIQDRIKNIKRKCKKLERKPAMNKASVVLLKLPDIVYENHIKSKPIRLSTLMPTIIRVESLSDF